MAGHFGKKLSLPVDGKVYASPLSFSDNGRTIVVAATEHGAVYAFDAATGATVWQTSLLQPGFRPFEAAQDRVRAFDAADISPELWNSDRDRARDGLDDTGGSTRSVAAGEVVVGDRSHLEIYATL